MLLSSEDIAWTFEGCCNVLCHNDHQSSLQLGDSSQSSHFSALIEFFLVVRMLMSPVMLQLLS